MKMTFDEYASNPMGVHNSVFSRREMYRELYKQKLDAILLREVGKVKYTLYQSKDKFYIYFKIPSEVVPKFYYDTVIEFYSDSPEATMSKSLKKYLVKFYSNDPSFVFTFAHSMIHNKMFISDLEPKMSKLAIKKVAEEKNPKNEIGYVKSIYFAYILMKEYSLFEKVMFTTYAESYNKKTLLDLIQHADDKINDRQDKGETLRKKKSIDKKKERSTLQADTNKSANINISNTANSSMKSKTTSTVKKAKTISKKTRVVK